MKCSLCDMEGPQHNAVGDCIAALRAKLAAAEKRSCDALTLSETIAFSKQKIAEFEKRATDAESSAAQKIKTVLLRYCYCGPSDLPSVSADGAAGTAPVADTCRIHYALAELGLSP